MRKKCNENTPIRPTLEKMQVGDVVFFPVSRLGSIKTTSSNYGLETDRYFKTAIQRKKRTISVERTK
jgi:hypothetical protein